MLERHQCHSLHEQALREILQEIALVGLWRGKFFEHAAFYEGTALRIFHDPDRFSEDLDFTLLTKCTRPFLVFGRKGLKEGTGMIRYGEEKVLDRSVFLKSLKRE
jgi:hypothetical protein